MESAGAVFCSFSSLIPLTEASPCAYMGICCGFLCSDNSPGYQLRPQRLSAQPLPSTTPFTGLLQSSGSSGVIKQTQCHAELRRTLMLTGPAVSSHSPVG